jgi:hypothetical protein
MGRIWQEATEAYFDVFFLNLHGRTEEHHAEI